MIKFMARTVTLALIIIMFGIFTQVTSAQDDSAFFEDYLLENGDSIEADFVDGVNAHLYAFLASRGDVVTISMTQLDPESNLLDPYLILLNAQGSVVAVDDDGGDLFLSAQIKDARIPANDVYYVIALDSYGRRFAADTYIDNLDNPMSYELSLRGANEPDDYELPDFAMMEYGDQLSLEVTQDTATAFALFEGEDGDSVTITTADAGDNIDTILYLFNPAGSRVAVNDDGEGYYSQIDSYQLEEDGIYFILATVWGYEQSVDTPPWQNGGRFILSLDN